MIRPGMSRAKPERIDYASRTDDNHNGADQAMAADLLATFEKGAKFPVTVEDSMEAGLTVMAIDRAQDRAETVDCRDMWSAYDEARAVIA
jgi:hypothetical protein